MLENTYTRVVRDRRAHLVTIFGEPGVGKSRLAREFLDTLEGATVLQGRCLPYGEGITYWPLAEMVKVSAGIHDDEPVREAFDKLRACCEDEAIADLLANASGVLEAVEAEATGQEIAWAAREWGAKLAEPQPLVLVFEDIHWAEEPLLELIEHLAEYVRDAPLIILALARPELLEVRPSWGGGRLRSAAIELEPLADDEAEQLIDALMAGTTLEQTCRAEILDVTEGNPLFVEETIRMLAESDGTLSIADGHAEHAAGADRRAHRPAARRGEAADPARRADRPDLLGGRAHAPVAGARRDRAAAREPRAPRARPARVAFLDLGRARVQVQARADPRGRLRRALEVGARRAARAVRGLAEGARGRGAARDPRVPPRPRRVSPRRARRRDAGRPRRRGGRGARGRGSPRDGARVVRDRAEAASCARSSSSRTSSGAGTPRARRSGSATCTPSRSEMEKVRALAVEQGSKKLEATALAALAEVALYTQADLPRAKELATQALDVLPDDAPIGAKIEALNVRVSIANWIGDHETAEKYLRHVLDAAHDAGAEGSRGQRDPGSRVALHHEARPRRGATAARARDGARGGEWRRARQGSGARALRQPEHDRGEPRRGRGLLHARRSTSTARSGSRRESPGGSSTSARSRGSAATSRRRRSATARP